MLKTTLLNLRNQCAYKPTAQDILCAIALTAIFIAAAIMEGGAIL